MEPAEIHGYQGNPNPHQQLNQRQVLGPQQGHGNPHGPVLHHEPGAVQGHQGNPHQQHQVEFLRGADPQYALVLAPPQGIQFLAPIEEAITLLDRVPHPNWGTRQDKIATVGQFNTWRLGRMDANAWIVKNILLMEENTFRVTLDKNQQMTGMYKFSAYVRMHNFLHLPEEQKNQCMRLGDVPAVEIPREEKLQHLTCLIQRRTDCQHLQVDEHLAKAYLDDERNPIEGNVTERLRHALQAVTWKAGNWIAANIRGVRNDHILGRVEPFGPEERRTQNWLNMHESWREEFMEIAYIPFNRRPVRWNPNRPENLQFFTHTPPSDPHLLLTDQLANNFLNRIPIHRFSTRQTNFLFTIWIRKNPNHRQFVERFVVREVNSHNRKLNWLTLNPRWKEIFAVHFGRERNNQ